MAEDVKQRTLPQNSAMHLLLKTVSDELNSGGMTMMRVLSHDAEIPWTPEATKEFLLRPFIRAMYQKESTVDLTTKELSDAVDAMLVHLAKVTGMAFEFPSLESMHQEFQERGRVWR